MTPDRAARAYDLAMRLPILAYNGYFLAREIRALAAWLMAAPVWDLQSFSNLVARIALILFLGLVSLFQLTRRRPIGKAAGLLPRFVALLGAGLTSALLFLPHGETSAALNIASSCLILLGNYLSINVVALLGRSISIMPEARSLVTTGAYRWVRHPLYLTEEIAILGVFLQFRSWAAVAIVLAHAACQLGRMHYEERVLAQCFPDYAAYARRTARLIPGFY